MHRCQLRLHLQQPLILGLGEQLALQRVALLAGGVQLVHPGLQVGNVLQARKEGGWWWAASRQRPASQEGGGVLRLRVGNVLQARKEGEC